MKHTSTAGKTERSEGVVRMVFKLRMVDVPVT